MFSALCMRVKFFNYYNIEIPPEKNYSRENERTICIRSTDCLLNQIRFKCCCHATKIYNILFIEKYLVNM